MKINLTYLAMILLLLTSISCTAQKPLLITWGQSTPDSTLLAENAAYWESQLPFDGIVIPINQKRYSGRYGHTAVNAITTEHWPLNHVVFDHRKIDPSEYQHVIDDLQSANFKKFKHNFIALYTYPHMNFAMNWFDDELWDRLLHNVGVLAWIAKESGCKGIWFDTEQYGAPRLWNYNDLQEVLPDHAADFQTYQAKAAQRGEQFIRAINDKFPGIEMNMVFGSCIIHADLQSYEPAKGKHFSHARYSLLAPFIDGMMRAADKNTVITDAFELSYYYKTEDEFAAARPIVKQACSEYSLTPDQYTKKIKLGLGLWPTHHGMFNRDDFTNNKYSPAELTEAIHLAMKHTDKYVWIWSERTSFWVKDGPDAKPIMPLQPHASAEPDPGSQFSDPAHLTAAVTADNAMRPADHALPQVYLDAIFAGKRLGQ
jgi:hypothetical protein